VRDDGLKDCVAKYVPDIANVPKTNRGTEYILCDYTVNYSLIRREVMASFKWDEKYKIGGDHIDLYKHCWELHKDVAYVKGVNVNTLEVRNGCHPSYGKYRGRARLALPWTFERHGWNSWTYADGTIETRESVKEWADKHEASMRMPLVKQVSRKTYCIDPNYVHRDHAPHYDATTT